MKKKFFTAFVLLTAGIVTAGAETKTFTAQTRTREHLQRRPPTLTQPKAVGAFPRTARNPIQLLNPRAPPRYYGPPQETVVYDTANYEANHHPQVSGLILFGLVW